MLLRGEVHTPQRGCRTHGHPLHVTRRLLSPIAATDSHLLQNIVEECSIDNWRSPLRCDVPEVQPGQGVKRGVVVALGKFDAMHKGHRALAVQAAKDGGHPFLLSFSGMASVLGWEQRLPLTAPCDRPRVLASWAPWCKGRVPRQRMVPFHKIRGMSPEEFVALLAEDLKVEGVVAGSNYRFGYRAKGDAAALSTLGAQHGLSVTIVDLISDDSIFPPSSPFQGLASHPSGDAHPSPPSTHGVAALRPSQTSTLTAPLSAIQAGVLPTSTSSANPSLPSTSPSLSPRSNPIPLYPRSEPNPLHPGSSPSSLHPRSSPQADYHLDPSQGQNGSQEGGVSSGEINFNPASLLGDSSRSSFSGGKQGSQGRESGRFENGEGGVDLSKSAGSRYENEGAPQFGSGEPYRNWDGNQNSSDCQASGSSNISTSSSSGSSSTWNRGTFKSANTDQSRGKNSSSSSGESSSVNSSMTYSRSGDRRGSAGEGPGRNGVNETSSGSHSSDSGRKSKPLPSSPPCLHGTLSEGGGILAQKEEEQRQHKEMEERGDFLVSSSKIRELLAQGDVRAVWRLLGRPYRLVAGVKRTDLLRFEPHLDAFQNDGALSDGGCAHQCVVIPSSLFQNLSPNLGWYKCIVAIVPCSNYSPKSESAQGNTERSGEAEGSSGGGSRSGSENGVRSEHVSGGDSAASMSPQQASFAVCPLDAQDKLEHEWSPLLLPSLLEKREASGVCDQLQTVQLTEEGIVISMGKGSEGLDRLRGRREQAFYVVIEFESCCSVH